MPVRSDPKQLVSGRCQRRRAPRRYRADKNSLIAEHLELGRQLGLVELRDLSRLRFRHLRREIRSLRDRNWEVGALTVLGLSLCATVALVRCVIEFGAHKEAAGARASPAARLGGFAYWVVLS